MTGHEAALFQESEKLRLKRKSDIQTENEQRRKRLDDKDVIEKALRDRHTKRQREKELDKELEILEEELEAEAAVRSQLLARSFPKDGPSQDLSVIPPIESSDTPGGYFPDPNIHHEQKFLYTLWSQMLILFI